MRIVDVIQEIPYPPNHGGRADAWRRLGALTHAGHEVFVVTWAFAEKYSQISPEDLAQLAAVSQSQSVLKVDRSIIGLARRLFNLVWWPSHIAARVVPKSVYKSLYDKISSFEPDIVLMDGLQGYWLSARLSVDLERPLIYRAHNREFHYLTGQLKAAVRWKAKFSLWLATRRLEQLEVRAHQLSRRVLDISVDDLAVWKEAGFTNGIWLPPLMDSALELPEVATPSYDFAYLGNLVAPNNVAGVLWFLSEVWPQIKTIMPSATAVIAGLNPTSSIVDACRAHAGITLTPNVANPADVLLDGRVLINPVLMSSGVNIKSIDMLTVGAPIVSTTHGVRGLPPDAASLFAVADSAAAFADECVGAVASSAASREKRREMAARYFAPRPLEKVFATLLELPG